MIPSHSNGGPAEVSRSGGYIRTGFWSKARAAKAGTASRAKADEALKQITTLLGEDWTSTENSARAGVDYVEARGSGAEHIASVTDARGALAKIKLPTDCVEREEVRSSLCSLRKPGRQPRRSTRAPALAAGWLQRRLQGRHRYQADS